MYFVIQGRKWAQRLLIGICSLIAVIYNHNDACAGFTTLNYPYNWKFDYGYSQRCYSNLYGQ